MQKHSVLASILLLVAARTAAATEITCEKADPGFALVDGDLREWGEVGSVTVSGPGLPVPGGSWSGKKDAEATVRCVYDDDSVTFSIWVTDDRVIRSAPPDAQRDDHVELAFADGKGVRRLQIFPPDGEKIKLAARWMPGAKPAKGIEIAGGAGHGGYGIEVGFPNHSLPGWSKGAPRLPFALFVADGDQKVDKSVQAILTTARGTGASATDLDALNFEEGDADFHAFLKQLNLSRKDITLDQMADVDGNAGKERVVAGSKIVGAISRGFTYFTIPVQMKGDVREVRLVDLAGEGRSSVLVRYLERGNGGSREVLAVWNLNGSTWQRTFGHELGKFAGQSKLTNTYTVKKRDKGRGQDLSFAVGEVVGFTEADWHESPAEDLTPIILPWGPGPKVETFRFHGYEFEGPIDESEGKKPKARKHKK